MRRFGTGQRREHAAGCGPAAGRFWAAAGRLGVQWPRRLRGRPAGLGYRNSTVKDNDRRSDATVWERQQPAVSPTPSGSQASIPPASRGFAPPCDPGTPRKRREPRRRCLESAPRTMADRRSAATGLRSHCSHGPLQPSRPAAVGRSNLGLVLICGAFSAAASARAYTDRRLPQPRSRRAGAVVMTGLTAAGADGYFAKTTHTRIYAILLARAGPARWSETKHRGLCFCEQWRALWRLPGPDVPRTAYHLACPNELTCCAIS